MTAEGSSFCGPGLNSRGAQFHTDKESRPDKAGGSSCYRKRLFLLFALSAVGLSLTVYFSLDYLRANREWGRAEAALRRHDLDSAANHLEDYLATRPADASGWFLAARTARRRERFPEASR